MSAVTDQPFRLSLHGLAVELRNTMPHLQLTLRALLGRFRVPEFPEGFFPVQGIIQPYDELDVLRHVSPDAIRYTRMNDPLEIYYEQERFWLVDERWGMAEINLLKAQWRSWLLPNPRLDPDRLVEMSVLWPMAQLLRARGLHVMPGTALVREGWGVLLLSPVGIGGELSALLAAGFKIVARNWVALRQEDGRIAMFHLPAMASHEGMRAPNPASEAARLSRFDSAPGRQPLALAPINHAFCHAVAIVDPVRRPAATLNRLDAEQARIALRAAWPITELHPHRRHSPLPGQLAQNCRCWEFNLSPRRHDLLWLLESARHNTASPALTAQQAPLTPTRRAG